MVGRALVTCLLFISVYGAIIPNQDEPLKRTARCAVCDQGIRIPHPPPPPFFHTHQWSGLARSSDGTQQGVFSGAAAAANGGGQAAGEAFSLASSSANGGGDYHGSNDAFIRGYKDPHYQSARKNFGQGASSQAGAGAGFGANLQQSQTHGFDQGQQVQSGFGSGAAGQAQNAAVNSWDQEKHASNHVGQGFGGNNERGDISGHFKYSNNEAHTQAHSQSSQGGHIDIGQQQQSHANSGSGGYGNSGFQSASHHAVETEFHGNNQEAQRGYYEGEKLKKGFNGHGAESQSSSAAGSGGHDDGQSTLRGALDLAHQGLQTAQQTQQSQQPGQPGCSSCGKSNYALSNAKTKSGNAVAVSIGG